MQRTLASFVLATLSLLTSYAIVATWPDPAAAKKPVIAQVVTPAAPVVRADVPTVIGLAD